MFAASTETKRWGGATPSPPYPAVRSLPLPPPPSRTTRLPHGLPLPTDAGPRDRWAEDRNRPGSKKWDRRRVVLDFTTDGAAADVGEAQAGAAFPVAPYHMEAEEGDITFFFPPYCFAALSTGEILRKVRGARHQAYSTCTRHDLGVKSN